MSKIEWCDETINPIVGCSPVSPACKNCYAVGFARRLAGTTHSKERYAGTVDKNGWTGKLNFVPSELEKPAKWKKPRRVFVGSMTDLFHSRVFGQWLSAIMQKVVSCPQHTFIFLTKRPQRMKGYLENWLDGLHPFPNLWLGVTAENQEQFDKRVPILLSIPAAVRFVSVEPMLEDMGISHHLPFEMKPKNPGRPRNGIELVSTIRESGVDWIICGPENGTNKRPFNEDWARSIRDQCKDADVPFFYKGGELDGVKHEAFPK